MKGDKLEGKKVGEEDEAGRSKREAILSSLGHLYRYNWMNKGEPGMTWAGEQ